MSPMVYTFPSLAFRKAANAKIKLVGNGIYGSGTLAGSLTTPPSSKIQAIFDTRATDGAPLPRFVWTGRDVDPDTPPTAVFHNAVVLLSLTGNIYSGRFESGDEVDELADRLMRLFHHQPLTVQDFVVRELKCRIVSSGLPDPVGQRAILQFDAELQYRP